MSNSCFACPTSSLATFGQHGIGHVIRALDWLQELFRIETGYLDNTRVFLWDVVHRLWDKQQFVKKGIFVRSELDATDAVLASYNANAVRVLLGRTPKQG